MQTDKRKNQKGQAIMEYIILSSLIGVFCIFMITKFGKSLNQKIKSMNTRVENIELDYKSGS